LPNSGGAPIRNESFPWGVAIAGVFCAILVGFGIRATRSSYRSK
jgi:high-affinity Fe2+/Pb2+ permease